MKYLLIILIALTSCTYHICECTHQKTTPTYFQPYYTYPEIMPFRNIPSYPAQPYYIYKGIGIGVPIDTLKLERFRLPDTNFYDGGGKGTFNIGTISPKYRLNIEPCRHSNDSIAIGSIKANTKRILRINN